MNLRRNGDVGFSDWLDRPCCSLVNHCVCVLPHDLIIFGFRQGHNFLPFANRLRPHVFLETGSRKDGNQTNRVASDVVNGNPCVGWDEDSSTTMHFSYRVAQTNLCHSVFKNRISSEPACLWDLDFSSRWQVFRHKDQM